MSGEQQGYVYILISPNCDSLKIGGSDYPPFKRLKEINHSEPYKRLGKWELADFRQVHNWRKVERSLHYAFRSRLNTEQPNQKELFRISLKEAADALNGIDEAEIIGKPKIDRMFYDVPFRDYLQELFVFSGLTHWLAHQGAWTFALFPATEGGRYFTLNIGSHEVAYATINRKNRPSMHMILTDKLILDFPEVAEWLSAHEGKTVAAHYQTAWPRAVCIYFYGDFTVAAEFLRLAGVRRALIAYWHDALFDLKDNEKMSTYARFHHYNAVAKLNEYISQTR